MATNSNLEKLSGKNVLLTGGCGFIGSEITKQLSEIGSNLTIIDNFSSGKEGILAFETRYTIYRFRWNGGWGEPCSKWLLLNF